MGDMDAKETSGNGWLASSFGCCAPSFQHADGHHGASARADPRVRSMTITYDQPRLIPPLRPEPQLARPSTGKSMQKVSDWASSSIDLASRASAHAISTFRPKTQYSVRPSISAPTDFRRVEQGIVAEPAGVVRRRSFRPLELSIYLPDGRLSPLPDFSSEFLPLPAELEQPALAHVRHRRDSLVSIPSSNFQIHRKPVGSSFDLTSSLRRSQSSTRASVTLSTVRADSIIEVPRPSFSTFSTPPVAARTFRTRTPSPATRSRANTEPLPHSPQRGTSIRRTRTDVDEAIRELNTIVEERRAADACKTTNLADSPTDEGDRHHIPAIAPSMKVGARSETLSDIGSAFTSSFLQKPLPFPPSPYAESSTSLAAGPPTPDLYSIQVNPFPYADKKIKPSTRVLLTRWLSRKNSSANDRAIYHSPIDPDDVPFYKCTTSPLYAPGFADPPRPSVSTTSTYTTLASAPSLINSDTSLHTSVSPSPIRSQSLSNTASPVARRASAPFTDGKRFRSQDMNASVASVASMDVNESHPGSPVTPPQISLGMIGRAV